MATTTRTSVHLNNEFALFQTSSLLYHFVKCWEIFVDLNSYKSHPSSGKEKENRLPVCMSSMKREIRPFDVVVVQ